MSLETKLARAIYVASVTLFLTSLGCWALLAHQDTSSSPSSQAASASMSDHSFAKEAAQGGMAEVKLGQLAQDRGSNQMVKSFGERMVVEHSSANDKLKDAASKSNIQIPTDVSAKDQALYDRLSKLSGSEFDRAYAKAMVEDHTKDVSDFRKEAKMGKDPNIKMFAQQTLPTLEEHLNQAKEMQKSVAGSASGSGGSSQP
jgi:putative membrane protein